VSGVEQEAAERFLTLWSQCHTSSLLFFASFPACCTTSSANRHLPVTAPTRKKGIEQKVGKGAKKKSCHLAGLVHIHITDICEAHTPATTLESGQLDSQVMGCSQSLMATALDTGFIHRDNHAAGKNRAEKEFV